MTIVARIAVPLRGRDDIVSALNALTLLDLAELQQAPLPGLYQSGVRYQREGMGREQWRTALQVLRAGAGDCEDLCAWRAAELTLAGTPARAMPVQVGPGQWHVVVAYLDGFVEDPSIELGMEVPPGFTVDDLMEEAARWTA